LPSDVLARQFFADLTFYVCLNVIGFYGRYVGEINLRRGFLDKQGCIEATFKLKLEKGHEVFLKELPKDLL